MTENFEEYLDSLQNNTIQLVDVDKNTVAILLSNGITLHLCSDSPIYMGIERALIN
jgi:hypothetical protein